MFVNNDIRKDMYNGMLGKADAQFKKLFIYHMENVSILFADIKVSCFDILSDWNIYWHEREFIYKLE